MLGRRAPRRCTRDANQAGAVARRPALRAVPAPRSALLAVMLGALLCAGGPRARADTPDLAARVARLERLLNANSLVDLFDRVQQLESDVRDLRGRVEVLTYQLKRLRAAQQQQYLDLDKRLRKLEGQGTPGAGGAASTQQPKTTAPAAPGAGSAAAAGAPAPAAPAKASSGSTAPAAGAASASVAPATGTAAQPSATPSASSGTAATPPAAPAQSGGASKLKEQTDYQAALDLLKNGDYGRAGKALASFVKSYPQGEYAPNAQYWLGESHYVRGEYAAALRAFQAVLKRYPDSRKVPGAMLKVGYVEEQLGHKAEARHALEALVHRYPQTAAATLARRRLEQLRKGGG